MCDHIYHLSTGVHELDGAENPTIFRKKPGEYVLIVQGTCSNCGETVQVSGVNAEAYTVD